MNKKKIIIIIFLAILHIFNTNMFAQNNIKITGKIIDSISNLPLEYATISIYNQNDNKLITGIISDVNGDFILSVNEGLYKLKIEFLSYNSKEFLNLKLTSQNKIFNFGNVYLSQNVEKLKQVDIVSEKSQMEFKFEKKIVNVSADLSNIGKNASDILNNVPSVNVDMDGNVSLRGSQNVRILVDGKPSGLVGLSNTNGLRSLQGDIIDKIEVITNPSARYDAEGEAGIINIVLKKDKKKGLNGSIALTGGYPYNFILSNNLNFRNKKFNFFTILSLNYRNIPGNAKTYQNNIVNSIDYIIDNSRTHYRSGLGGNFQTGIDLFLNERNTITLSGLVKYTSEENGAKIGYNEFNINNQINTTTQLFNRNSVENANVINIEANLNYIKTFKKPDQKLTFDFKYIMTIEPESQNYSQNFSLPINKLSINQRANLTENETNWIVQTDFIHPFSDKSKFETGLKATFRNIENRYLVEQEDTLVKDKWDVFKGFGNTQSFDDKFTYNEYVFAGYIMYSNKIKRFSFQAGLRPEYTEISSILEKSALNNNRNFFYVFPSASLSYEFSKSFELQSNYSYRISRPRFRDILNFNGISDITTNFKGSPYINPETTHSVEIGAILKFKNGSLFPNLYYRYKLDPFSRITVSNGDGTATIIPINLKYQELFGAETNLSYDWFKWWKFNMNLNLNYVNTVGSYNISSLNNDFFNWQGRMTNRFVIAKKINIQNSLMYMSERLTGQGKILDIFFTDLSASMDLFKNKATISLNFSDVFNSRIFRIRIDTPNFKRDVDFRWATQQVTLTFTYRINQDKKQERKREGGGGPPDDGGGTY